MVCKPSRAAANSDAFAFGNPDVQVQGLRNVAVLIALPWAAAWVLGAEMAAEALRRAGL